MVHRVFLTPRTEPTRELSVAGTMFGRCVRREAKGGIEGPDRSKELLIVTAGEVGQALVIPQRGQHDHRDPPGRLRQLPPQWLHPTRHRGVDPELGSDVLDHHRPPAACTICSIRW
ncbi:hypothetical protein [Streptomyces sp. SD31]|uniref:hypothetical protein n=1 Tax=Streptomyces sp. SD31 TaxID=3452208 RepID=UPI003F89719F